MSGGRLGPISVRVVRAIGDYLVKLKLFVVQEEGVSWRFDPYGGSMDSEGNLTGQVRSMCALHILSLIHI